MRYYLNVKIETVSQIETEFNEIDKEEWQWWSPCVFWRKFFLNFSNFPGKFSVTGSNVLWILQLQHLNLLQNNPSLLVYKPSPFKLILSKVTCMIKTFSYSALTFVLKALIQMFFFLLFRSFFLLIIFFIKNNQQTDSKGSMKSRKTILCSLQSLQYTSKHRGIDLMSIGGSSHLI